MITLWILASAKDDSQRVVSKEVVAPAIPRVGETLYFGSKENDPKFTVSEIVYRLDTGDGLPQLSIRINDISSEDFDYLRELDWKIIPYRIRAE